MNFLTEITDPIVSFVELRWFSSADDIPASGVDMGIDMGNGQRVSAEDVLDGHFQRLVDPRSATSARLDDAQRHAERSLNPAIQRLSPGLAPLTKLADNIAEQAETAHPTPKFRQNLHSALEKAHQEQAAKRVLGIQPQTLPDEGRLAARPAWVMLLVGVSTVVGFFVACSLYRRFAARCSE